MKIKHLKHNEIDKNKWDEVVNSAANHLIYAESWFLDIVSPEWEALVSHDFQFVMPLPVKSKFRLKYIVQPQFTQQLGVFSKEVVDESVVKRFIKNIPYFSYELHLNEKNCYTKSTKRLNLTLNLNKKYDILERNFSKNCRRNVKRGIAANLSIKQNLSIDNFILFYRTTETRHDKLNESLAKELFTEAKEKGKLILIGAKDNNNKLTAALPLLKSGDRLINILPVSDNRGKRLSAMFFLIDYIIRTHADNEVILDFEGSMIEGVARFYRGFGAKEQYYPLIKKFRPNILIGRI